MSVAVGSAKIAHNVPQLCVRAGGRDEVLSPDTNANAKIQTLNLHRSPPDAKVMLAVVNFCPASLSASRKLSE